MSNFVCMHVFSLYVCVQLFCSSARVVASSDVLFSCCPPALYVLNFPSLPC